jgi:hypothetical protein
VGVRQRVAFPAGAVVEPHHHQALAAHLLVAAVAAAGADVSV